MRAESLRSGQVSDAAFDEQYSPLIRTVSSQFWTPVSVAARAAELLVKGPTTRVLDVGSGPGKFCVVGAVVTGANFVGVEHRPYLVQMARDAAARWGVERATFLDGTFDAIDIASYDAVYLFNPFHENLWVGGYLDRTVPLSESRYVSDIDRAEALLERARVGTRVVTYHGFGGEMPSGYLRVLRERCGTDYLELWRKERDSQGDGRGILRPAESAA